MKYIITEQQKDYLERWKKFQMFMIRRDNVIKELISKYAKRPGTYPDATWANVVVEFANTNNIDTEDELFDWVAFYVKDNYGELIGKMYEEERVI